MLLSVFSPGTMRCLATGTLPRRDDTEQWRQRINLRNCQSYAVSGQRYLDASKSGCHSHAPQHISPLKISQWHNIDTIRQCIDGSLRRLGFETCLNCDSWPQYLGTSWTGVQLRGANKRYELLPMVRCDALASPPWTSRE